MSTLGNPTQFALLALGSYWKLKKEVNGYAHEQGEELVTQASIGRCFQILDFPENVNGDFSSKRIKVRLLEDGYQCWLDTDEFLGEIVETGQFKPTLLKFAEINNRLPRVLAWVEEAANHQNKYLWGGTLGPDFDCSGLVQAGFAQQGIWLPRDAYQQERFCRPLKVSPENLTELIPGDLVFFGDSLSCSHVAIYRGNGFYWHSSGSKNGRDGIGCDCLTPNDLNPIACHYRSQLRGAGRVECCHDGTTLS